MSTPVKSGPEFLVNTTTYDFQYHPTITALPDGRFVAIWADESEQGGDGSYSGIKGQIFNADGSKAGTEFLVNTATADYQEQPTVVALADGRFVVVWTDWGGSDGSESGVKGQVFNGDGSKVGTEFLVNSATYNGQFEPTITALANGGFVVAWTDDSEQGDPDGSGIKGQVFGSTGIPAGPEFLVNTAKTSDQDEPTIAALADGRFVVAWTNEQPIIDIIDPSLGDPTGFNIRARIFNPDGSTAGAELLVNATTDEYQYEPAIMGLTNGGFVVTWTDTSGQGGDASGQSVKGQLFNAAGAKVGGEFLVNTTTNDRQYEPAMAALPDGRFVVTWTDDSGDTSGAAVRGQIFNADGSKSGAEFLVNTTTNDEQRGPTITVLADGRFVVGWTDWSESADDTSEDAVRGQIFDPRGAVTLNGSEAADQFVGTAFGDTLRGSLGADSLRGEGGDDTLEGEEDNDTLFGGLGNDRLFGGSENDALYGEAGSDRLVGEEGNDTLFGGGANDLLKGGSGADQLYGEDGNDRLHGEDGNDRLEGGEGHDLLAGGLGRDVLTGGTGQDAFVFDTKPHKSTNVDTITDFSHADDTIRLENAIFTKLGAAGVLKSGALANWNAKDQADDRIIYRHVDSSDAGTKKDTILLYYDANGGSTADAVLFAKLTNQASMILKASDFLIV
jgi:hypothetical protein